MSDLLNLATDPQQYDKLDDEWLKLGNQSGPWGDLIKEALDGPLGDLNGKSVLDVGCGTGWFSEQAFRHSAKSYLGLDPSKQNYKVAKSTYPKAKFENATFEEFVSQQKFDLVAFIMSTEHVKDLKGMFEKLINILSDEGRALILAGDYTYFITPTFNREIIAEKMNSFETVVHTRRPKSVDTVDIIRKKTGFIKVARQAGFTKISHQPVKPSVSFLEAKPKYKVHRSKPIFQLYELSR